MIKKLQQKDGSYKCPMCTTEMKGKRAEKNMADHIVDQCRQEELYQCDDCGRNYGKKYDLNQHKKMKHNESNCTYSCRSCDFKTSYKKSLTRHMAKTCKPISD